MNSMYCIPTVMWQIVYKQFNLDVIKMEEKLTVHQPFESEAYLNNNTFSPYLKENTILHCKNQCCVRK
jgi:hypothetical protein